MEQPSKSLLHRHLPLLAALLACLLLPAHIANATDDLSGYWLGEIGSPREKVSIGLNLQADANGRYDMQLDLPIAHLRSLPLHGKADLDDNNTLVHRSLHMALRMQDKELTGTLLGSGERLRLRRGDRDSLSSTTPGIASPQALPGPRWKAHLGGQIFASPVVADGIAYIGTTAGTLFAVDLSDGSLRWGSALGYPIYATALVTDDAVFVNSDGGYLHRLDRKTGREQWRSSIQDARGSREPPQPQSAAWEWQGPRPLLANGWIYIGGGDGSVQALDMHTGASRWKRQLPGGIQHGLASDGTQLFAITESGVVQALNARTGTPLWQYRLASRPGAAPVVYRGRVFCNDRSGVLHAIDANTGNALWLTQFWTSWIESEPSFDGNTLYIGSSDLRKVSAIDIVSGRVLWRTDVGGWSWGTPLALGDQLLVGMGAGHPYFLDHTAGIGVLDRRDGRLLATHALTTGRGFQWGIAGTLAHHADVVVAADIEGVLMGFALDAMIQSSNTNAQANSLHLVPTSLPPKDCSNRYINRKRNSGWPYANRQQRGTTMTRHRLTTHALHAALSLALASASGHVLAASTVTPAQQLPVEVTGASIIPRPVSVQPGNGRFLVDASTHVLGAEGTGEVAAQFTQLLARTTPLQLQVTDSGNAKGAIQFRISPPPANAASPESYSLRISADGVLVEAGDARGLFYGAMSLWQLLSGSPANSITLPAMQVEDAPRFSWRGFMLDSARHFQSIDDIKLILDAMATHKLNTFHWHLTDDQGWRMEIKRYPKLTEVGSCRAAAGEAGVGADGKPHLYCGYYTQEQIRDVVAYAAARHITVVPEIDVPGHAQAAVAAYPEHGVVDGPTQPSANWGVNPYLFNPREETLQFLENILAEVLEMFPGQYIHIGGDEAVKYQWQDSPQVQAYIRELGLKDEEALQSHMLKRLEKYLEDHDRKLIGWDEIIEGGLPPQATVMSWRGIEGGIEAATHGHDVVMTPGNTLYLDFLQTNLPEEPTGRPKFTSMQRVYAFDPVPAELTPAQRKHVIGVQANMWTEHTRTGKDLKHNVFPRLAALSEIAWTPLQNKSYDDFLARLPAQLQRYKALGIGYGQTALSVAMKRQDDRAAGKVTVELSNPLSYRDIRYTTDGSMPTAQSAAYPGALTLPVPTVLTALTFFNGKPVADKPSQWNFDAQSLLARDDKTLAQCPQGGRLLLRLVDDNPLHGERDNFDVSIFNPCWLWEDAQLQDIASVKVRAGRIPYNFGLLRPEEAKRGFRKPVSQYGEFEVRAGCEGRVLATVPLPQQPGKDGFIELEAPLQAGAGQITDLCMTFSGDTRPQMWVLDQVHLQPKQ